MERGFKTRISRIFRSSLRSCRSKYINDVIQTSPLFLPDQNHRHPRPPTPPPDSGSKTHGHGHQKHHRKSSLLLTDCEGQKCPPVSPMTPFLNSQYDDVGDDHDRRRRLQTGAASSSSSKNKKTRKPKRVRSRIKAFGLHDEFPACSYNGLFSSDEEDDDDDDDKTTLFSSRSLSSDSSGSLPRSRSCRLSVQSAAPENHHHHRRRHGRSRSKDDLEVKGSSARSTGVLPGLVGGGGKVKDSFAVVKRSSDPYNDFRTSMVEMIVERQIFSGDELEKLLQCFLSLNSYHHHGVIVEVFSEIWAALFSNGS